MNKKIATLLLTIASVATFATGCGQSDPVTIYHDSNYDVSFEGSEENSLGGYDTTLRLKAFSTTASKGYTVTISDTGLTAKSKEFNSNDTMVISSVTDAKKYNFTLSIEYNGMGLSHEPKPLVLKVEGFDMTNGTFTSCEKEDIDKPVVEPKTSVATTSTSSVSTSPKWAWVEIDSKGHYVGMVKGSDTSNSFAVECTTMARYCYNNSQQCSFFYYSDCKDAGLSDSYYCQLEQVKNNGNTVWCINTHYDGSKLPLSK